MSTEPAGDDLPQPDMPRVDHLPASDRLDAILTHQARGWELGMAVPARQYLDAYPFLREDIAAGAAVLYQEYLLHGGERSPDLLVGYLRDFPEFADVLRLLRGLDEVVEPRLSAVDDPVPPRRFGGYELLERIGRGGMGVVWKARQISLNRVVALKLIRDPDLVAPATVERFRVEARAAAGLSHPNVVAVYEVGEEAGQHYLAMEYVEGGTLADLVSESPLPAMEAARYVELIAQAVQYAHQMGVVHRDLKPANVLLSVVGQAASLSSGEEGQAGSLSYVPKVADFGLARHGAHSLTATGEVIGTPSYMPPELARGEHKAGPPADVYGVGAILYELLTRRPPFNAATAVETLRQVIDTEPAAPRALNANIPPDLDTICLKCLEKDQAARYASAAELADDLARFQRGEPVRARPVGRLTRGWRWCRRNRSLAGLFLSLVVGLGGVSWQLWRVERQRAATGIERDRAQANLAKARDAVDFIGRRIGEIQLRHVPQVQEVQREVLEYALQFHEGLLEEAGDDPGVHWEVARACVRVGDIQGRLGATAKAEEAYRSAIRLIEELPADFPSTLERHTFLIGCHGSLHVLFQKANWEDHGKAIEAALERLFATYPAEHRGGESFRYQRASFLHNKTLRASPTKGVDLCQHSLALIRPLAGEYPENWSYKESLAKACNMLAIFLKRLDRLDEALSAYEEARNVQEQLASRSPGDATRQFDLAITTRNMVPLFLARKDHVAAERAAGQAEGLFVKLTRDYPSVPVYHSELGGLYHDLGLVRVNMRLPAEAVVLFEKAATCQRRAIEPDVRNLAYRRRLCTHCYQLANIHLDQGNHEPAAHAAAEMVRFNGGRAMDHFIAAGLLAKCAESARKDPRIPADKRAALADKYDAEVLRFLRQQSPKTWRAMQPFRSFPELAPLQRFEEFKKGMREGAK